MVWPSHSLAVTSGVALTPRGCSRILKNSRRYLQATAGWSRRASGWQIGAVPHTIADSLTGRTDSCVSQTLYYLVKVGLVACTLFLSACTTMVAAPDRLEPGVLEVRRNNNVELYDEVQDRQVNFQVSWPATDGPFPVIVFSHGAFCYPEQYATVTDFWVSRGYVVILPNHLDSPNGPKMKGTDLLRMQSSRVRDMSFALDALDEFEMKLPELAGRIDHNLAVVAGHSFGGLITMMKSGLRYETVDGQPAGFADPRFRVAVVMSGVGEMPPTPGMTNQERMSEDPFGSLTGPLFASGGTLDEGNVGTGVIYPWQWRMSGYTESPPGDKYSLVFENADHYLGGLICRDNRGGEADPEAARIVRAAQTAFLDAYIKQDAEALKWLKSTDYAALTNGRADFEYK